MEKVIQEKIEFAQREVLQHPEHQLSFESRKSIYYALGHGVDLTGQLGQQIYLTNRLSEALGYRRYARLSLITAIHVLPIWEIHAPHNPFLDEDELANPRLALRLGKELLNGTLTPLDAHQQNQYEELSLPPNADYAPYDALDAADAAYFAFLAVLGGYNDGGTRDVAYSASEAYTVLDDEAVVDEEAEVYIHTPGPVRYDVQKRLEFWQWWLTEAIPAAWALIGE